MIHVALYQPEIPQNTGNIIRLCANAGVHLHLIHPLGFGWDDKRLRRAGLDYHEFAHIEHHDSWQDFLDKHGLKPIFPCTTHATKSYADVSFPQECVLLFGPETRGLPPEIRSHFQPIRIPMRPESRSLNLSNAVAIITFEAWRQHAFK
jgi:tRNA (cytidine/uridine-2'-O-)-methyltransferase